MEQSLLALLFVLSGGVALVVAAVAWRRRHAAPPARALALVSASVGVWSVSDGIIALDKTLETVQPLLVLKFLAVGALPAGFLWMSRAIADRAWLLPRRAIPWLAVEPALVMVALLSNDRHHLFLTSLGSAGVHEGENTGPLFWAHSAYSYLLITAGVLHLLRAWMRSPHSQRRLYGASLLAALPPLLLNAAGTLEIIKLEYLTPVGFCVTTVTIHWALVRRSLYDLVPVERARLFDMLDDMVMTVDAAGRVLDLNPSAERLFHRLSPDLPTRLGGAVSTGALGRLPLTDGMAFDHTMTGAEGSPVDLNVRVSALRDRRGEVQGWAFVGRDVTALNDQHRELQEANERLRAQVATIEALRADLAEQAVRDPLTGLHNRRHLMEALRRELRLAAESGAPLSVAILDIDHFKQINDRYGHGAGDQVLMRFAKLVGGQVRVDDVLARYGGEEFVLVLPGATGGQAAERVDTIRRWVTAGRLPAGGHTLSVTFSAGVAALTGEQKAEDLLHSADEALYAAKRAGRNRVVLAPAEDASGSPAPEASTISAAA
ncbi:diguanylate cyclase [Planomonospora corallina]|uniref:Diguanylate cyclase n=1 Tax=Planomonospora corallina TaxID=1806052 RepID=A0ABV8I408_9ACTN